MSLGHPMVGFEKGPFRCHSGEVGSWLVGLFLPLVVGPGFQAWRLADFCLEREDFWRSDVRAGWRDGGLLSGTNWAEDLVGFWSSAPIGPVSWFKMLRA